MGYSVIQMTACGERQEIRIPQVNVLASIQIEIGMLTGLVQVHQTIHALKPTMVLVHSLSHVPSLLRIILLNLIQLLRPISIHTTIHNTGCFHMATRKKSVSHMTNCIKCQKRLSMQFTPFIEPVSNMETFQLLSTLLPVQRATGLMMFLAFHVLMHLNFVTLVDMVSFCQKLKFYQLKKKCGKDTRYSLNKSLTAAAIQNK